MRICAIICQVLCALTSTILAQVCYDDGSEFCLDEDDILSVDLLPGSFILNQPDNVNKKNVDNLTVDGSFNTAFGEMGFHRSFQILKQFCSIFLLSVLSIHFLPFYPKRS